MSIFLSTKKEKNWIILRRLNHIFRVIDRVNATPFHLSAESTALANMFTPSILLA
jgi:hypothetical protein